VKRKKVDSRATTSLSNKIKRKRKVKQERERGWVGVDTRPFSLFLGKRRPIRPEEVEKGEEERGPIFSR